MAIKNNLPKTWQIKKLGEDDICSIIMGQSPPSETYNKEKIGLPFYQGKKDFGSLYPTPSVWCSNPNKIVEANDVLISVRAPIGPTNLCLEKSAIGRGLAALRVNSKKLNFKFLLLYLQSIENTWIRPGTTFSAIKKSDLENLEISLPPLFDQHRIVEKIEELFEKIDKAKKLREGAIEETENLIPAALEEVFVRAKKEKWEQKRIGEVCQINPSKAEIRNLSENLDVSFIPMSAVDEISGTIKNYEVTKLKEVRKGYTYFKEGDVLFAKITPCMENGKSAIARNLKNNIGFGSTEFHVLRPTEKILPELLYFIIRQKSFKNEAVEHFTGTAGQQRVPEDFLRNKVIIVPPRSEQYRIVKYLDSLQSQAARLKQLQSETQKELGELKKSILDKAFKEKL